MLESVPLSRCRSRRWYRRLSPIREVYDDTSTATDAHTRDMTNGYETGRKPKDNDPQKPQTHPGTQGASPDLRHFIYEDVENKPHNELKISENGARESIIYLCCCYYLVGSCPFFPIFLSMPVSALVPIQGAESVPTLACAKR